MGERAFSGIGVGALALLAGFISLPILSLVIWTVDEGSWRAMTSPVALEALLLSVRTTAITMTILFVVGTPAAYVLSRAEFPGKRLVDTLIDIPAVLPPSAAGIALLLAFGKMGLLGGYLEAFGIQISLTTAAGGGRPALCRLALLRAAGIRRLRPGRPRGRGCGAG